MAVLMTAVLIAALVIPNTLAAPRGRLSLEAIGNYRTGVFDEGAAEIAAYDSQSERLFVINASAATVDILDISDPADPVKVDEIQAGDLGAGINSVAIEDGLVALAIEAEPTQNPGTAGFYNTDGELLASVQVGALPDMLTFTPDGEKVLVANEGEPDGYCAGGVDPVGSISIIDLPASISELEQSHVETVGFEAFNDDATELRQRGVRIYGPGATVAQDIEPEYITAARNSKRAWVSLQENNALAILDIASAEVTRIAPLGFKNHARKRQGLDASDRDDAINIRNWPARGMYQPDAIDSIRFKNRDYLVLANEGDVREYECFAEAERISDLDLASSAFPDAEELQEDVNLGRLNATITAPTNDEGDFTEIWSFGGRSFSVRNADGELVWDSGEEFEQITAEHLPEEFNSNNTVNDSFDTRSDDKGPEPEGIEVAKIRSKTYAFIALERVGGIIVYDITNPRSPNALQYITTRDFTGDPEQDTAGDLAPEGLLFISSQDSPTGEPLLIAANEVSGSTTVFEIQEPGKK
jgi:hypothetical protein